MAQSTPYFGLAFFDVGDNLADAINVQKEMERFVIIDRQLYGLYSIFGSGVIDGWQVISASDQTTATLSVEVEPGVGIVNLMAAETTFSTLVDSLPPNQVVYIFAQVTNLTAVNRTIRFFFGRSQFANNAIVLAAVVTSDTGIISIDNSIRREIGFQAVIDEQIKAHHHRGLPSKIDLETETKGQLPGNKIGDVSAEIVRRGKFTPDRFPLLPHDSLTGIGLFTHPEIDAMLRKIATDSEEQRLIELTIANTLKQHIFLKYKYDDADDEFLNEMLFIPGISPDTWIDWSATTAVVNEDTHCISGKNVEGGQSISVQWATKLAFEGAAETVNVVIDNTGVHLQRGDLDTLLVEGFETVGTIFTASLEAVNSQTGVTTDSSFQTQLNSSGKFHIQQTNRGVFVKTYTTPQDWSEWDRLSLSVKCTTASHGAVYMYIEDKFAQKSSVFQILDVNEVTTNADPLMQGFEERTMVLSAFTGRSNVTKLVIFVEDVENNYGFWLDNIRLRKSQSYVPQGHIRLRYNTSERVTYNSLVYETIQPNGTDVKARVRVADNESDLDDALFSPFVRSSDVFIQKGKWFEVDLQLFSNSDQTFTPTLTLVDLGITAESMDNGIVVDTGNEWAKGTSSNLDFINDGGTARIRTPVTVGNMVFLNQGSVSEVNDAKLPVFGLGNQNLPMSEWQAYDQLFDGTVTTGLRNPRSVVRTNDRRYILCDTDNHRVLIFDQTGGLLRAYCGANEDVVQRQEDVIGVTATYNSDTGILWLGFSKQITLTTEAFEKITLNIGSKQVVLSEEGQIITQRAPVTGRVIPVALTDEHQSLLNNTDEDCSVVYGTDFTPEYNQQFENQAIRVYFAPVSYHPFIYYPVFATEAQNKVNQFWICNATKLPFPAGSRIEPKIPITRNLQLFNPDHDTNVFTNAAAFTKTHGGMVLEAPDGNMYVAGVDQARIGMVISNPLNKFKSFYVSPVLTFPTFLDMDSDGFLWVAETSEFARGGRILQIEPRGSIVQAFGDVYTNINSVQCLTNGNLLVGT